MVKKKSKKLKKQKNKILYILVGLVIGIFIFTAGTMAIMVKDEIEKKLGPPPEKAKDPHLVVEDVFFMKLDTRSDGVEEETVEILTTVYITNDGLADARNVKITARPMDNSKNMAEHKVDKIVGNIPVQRTSEIELVVNVPSGTRNNVNLLIFEKGKLILRGSGSFVLEGSTNSPRYETESVQGTENDTDYDGMSDQWEQYYGLDPTDPTDANEDPDRDGVSNLGEYRAGTEPKEPIADGGKDDKEESDTSLATGAGIFVGVMILVVIIIIIAALAVAKSESSKWQSNYNYPVNTHPSGAYKFESITNYKPVQNQSQNQAQNLPKHCIHCGGWIANNICTTCGWRVPANYLLSTPPEGQVIKGNGSMKNNE